MRHRLVGQVIFALLTHTQPLPVFRVTPGPVVAMAMLELPKAASPFALLWWIMNSTKKRLVSAA